MAEFLTTKGITHAIDQIIKNAEEKLWIISPYLKIDRHFKELLEETDEDRRKVDIRVIYGKKELRQEEKNWLAGRRSFKIYFREHLHAKCYLNEKEVLLTSMNLYDYSQDNNDEMGVLVSRVNDSTLFDEILRESQSILKKSKEIREMVATSSPSTEPPPQPKRKSRRGTERAIAETARNGFCIRCNASVPLNPVQPYCGSCFGSWNRFQNPNYEEKYCHACGSDMATTMNKPVCLPCYRKYRYVLEFADA